MLLKKCLNDKKILNLDFFAYFNYEIKMMSLSFFGRKGGKGYANIKEI